MADRPAPSSSSSSPGLGGFLADLRLAARNLLRRPAFFALATVTLALGLGATAAVWTVVQSLLVEPLAYEDPEDLVILRSVQPRETIETGLSEPDLEDLRESLDSFASIEPYGYYGLSLDIDGEPREITTMRVGPGLFDTLGIEAAEGRTFLADESVDDGDRVVVLSHGLWTTQLGADPEVVGGTIVLDNAEWTVVGVMPEGFQFPPGGGRMWIPATDWGDDRSQRYLQVIARLAPGVDPATAEAELATVSRALAAEHPATNEGWEVRPTPLKETVVGSVRPALLAFLVAVGLVLLTACANVANLLLARGAARRQEIAVRTALGASRGRLITLLLAESLVLAGAGAVLGLALAQAGIELLASLGPSSLPRLGEISIDPMVIAFVVVAALVTVPLVGLLPALRLTRRDVAGELSSEGRSATTGAAGARLRSALTVAEVALSALLLIGAGLMVRSFVELMDQDFGFDPDGVAAVQVFVFDGSGEEMIANQRNFFRGVLEEMRATPGIEAAGAISTVPYSPLSFGRYEVVVSGRAEPEAQRAGLNVATPGLFETMGITLHTGRAFDSRDRQDSRPVVVINRAAADAWFPGESPVGQRLRLADEDEDEDKEVVGVVASVRHADPELDPVPRLYVPLEQSMSGTMSLVARAASGDAASVIDEVQRAVWTVSPRQAVWSSFPMETQVENATAQRRFATVLATTFALVTLLLAVVGLYGVISWSVARRTREIGIRMALGASTGRILALVVGSGVLLVTLGLALGLVAAFVLARFASGFLYGVQATDPLTYGAVAALLMLVALAACLAPALRAARVDPVRSLRQG